MSERIKLVEGDTDVVWTFTIKEDGTAVDLTGATVTLDVTDDGASANRVDDQGVTPDADQVTNPGVCAYTFSAADCTVTGGDTVRGQYRIKTVISGVTRFRDRGDFVLEKNGRA